MRENKFMRGFYRDDMVYEGIRKEENLLEEVFGGGRTRAICHGSKEGEFSI